MPSKIGNSCFWMNLSRSLGGKPERVAVALQIQEQLGAVIVLPLAGVHRAAPQPDDDRQMLDAHRALKFAGAAGRALKRGFLRNMLAEQRLLARRAELVQIPAHAQRDFFRVQNLPGVRGRAMLGAAAALDARIGLQRDQLRDVLAGVEAEIFVARQRRNFAERCRASRNTVTGLSTRCRCLVCGISGRKIRMVSVCAHHSGLLVLLPGSESRQIGDHQHENQQRDDAGFDTTAAPSQRGRTTNRRKASPAIEIATATANTAAKPK